jgi:hypothetical protein
MSLNPSDWIVFSCRICRNMVKVGAPMAGQQVICPSCRTKIHVPDRAPLRSEDVHPDTSATPLPEARETESKSKNLSRETWERGGRSIGGSLEFKDKLSSTKAPERQYDPYDTSQQMVRVNLKRRKEESLREDFDDPNVQRRRRRKKGKRKDDSYGSAAIKALLVLIVVLVGIVAYLLYSKKVDLQYLTGTAKKSWVAPPKTLELMAQREYMPELKATTLSFATAPTVDEMVKVIRDRERVEPKVRAYYTKSRPWIPFELRNMDKEILDVTADANFLVIPLPLANFDNRIISMEKTDEGFKVDWESFEGWCEKSWTDMMSERPATPTLMRVIMTLDSASDYFAAPFEEGDWKCYMLADVKNEHFLYGYVKRNSEIDVRVTQNIIGASGLTNDQKIAQHAVIRVRYPETAASSRQVEITEFLEKGWVFRENAIAPQSEGIPEVVPETQPSIK